MAEDNRSADRLRELESEVLQFRRELACVKGEMIHLKETVMEMTSRALEATMNADEISRPINSNLIELVKLLLKSLSTTNRQAMPATIYRLDVEFPKFDGSDFRRWASKCRQLFEVDATPTELRFKIISIHLQGKALNWHRCFMKWKKRREVNWAEYMEEMANRFVDTDNIDPLAELFRLKQEGSVMEYMDRFEELISEMVIAEEISIDLFLLGLKPEIRDGVRKFKRLNLADTMHLARMQEANLLTVPTNH
ncbi:uncharacterized protein LOC129307845 [Prosopis cineraria]|uniref:uncharacterized protein LOC129307845 n=1 Tax=Prosopis cineraria TaxID=364024 RepID=UPI0024103BD9|nr:uncharacterized protein LOC129307845 [Prosopis cineraria]